MFLSHERPTLETTRNTTLTPVMAFSMMQCAVICNSKHLRFSLTESSGERTCSVVVIWTRTNWQLAEHPRCDKTRERRKHARGENTRGEKREEKNPLSSCFAHACHSPSYKAPYKKHRRLSHASVLSSRCRNVRLYYPYLQYTNLFIFRFVSEHSLRSKRLFTTMFIL